MVNPLLATVAADAVTKVPGALNDSIVSNDQSQKEQTTFENQNASKANEEVVKQVPKTKEALAGIAAETEKQQGVVTKENLSNIQEQQKSGIQENKKSIYTLDDAEAANNEALANLQSLQAKAKIDPQRYVKELGVDGKIMTSIGLMVSGLGAGLSGQPNMAMQAFQSNIDRDINAQKQDIANTFERSKQILGVASSDINAGVQRQAVSQLATIKVMTGAVAALQAVQDNIKSDTQKQQLQVIIDGYNAKIQDTMLQFDSLHKGSISAGQQNTAKALGRVGISVMSGQGVKPYTEPVNNLTKQPEAPAAPAKEVGKPAEAPKKDKSFLETLGEMKKDLFKTNRLDMGE